MPWEAGGGGGGWGPGVGGGGDLLRFALKNNFFGLYLQI